jgi:CubicO group peptidase (beta-lactamase class C family)
MGETIANQEEVANQNQPRWALHLAQATKIGPVFRFVLLQTIPVVVFLVVSMTAQGCGREQARIVGGSAARLDSSLTSESRLGFSGSVLVLHHNDIRLLKTYGLADRSRLIPNSLSTRFPIASVTKQFAAAAALQLEASGLLRLDDPVDRYIGHLPSPYPAPTVAHLLTHTSGIIRAGTTFSSATAEEFLAKLATLPRESAPGERRRYSNAGYALLAAIIEGVTHVSFESYIESSLFQPSGMSCTTFLSPGVAVPQTWARGYDLEQSAAARMLTVGWAHRFAGPLSPLAGTPNFRPARPFALDWSERVTGGAATTLGDIARWERVLSAGMLVPQTPQLFVPRVPVEGGGRAAGQGYAWMMTRAMDGSRLALVSGDYWGYQSGYYRYLDADWTLFVASNTSLGRGSLGWPEIVRADFESLLCGSPSKGNGCIPTT